MTKRPATHLSHDDLERLRAALVRKRDELLAGQRGSEREQRGIADHESENGDVAERLIEQEAALRLDAIEAPVLADVERALQKLADGGYGVSEESGVAIPLARLDAIPWARRTADEEGS